MPRCLLRLAHSLLVSADADIGDYDHDCPAAPEDQRLVSSPWKPHHHPWDECEDDEDHDDLFDRLLIAAHVLDSYILARLELADCEEGFIDADFQAVVQRQVFEWRLGLDEPIVDLFGPAAGHGITGLGGL